MLALTDSRPDRRAAGPPAMPMPEVSRSDARTTARAVRGRWPISDELRERTIRTLEAVVSNPHHFDPRVVVQAAKTLLDADKINLDDESNAVKAPAVLEAADGSRRVDFSALSDEELDRYLEAGARL